MHPTYYLLAYFPKHFSWSLKWMWMKRVSADHVGLTEVSSQQPYDSPDFKLSSQSVALSFPGSTHTTCRVLANWTCQHDEPSISSTKSDDFWRLYAALTTISSICRCWNATPPCCVFAYRSLVQSYCFPWSSEKVEENKILFIVQLSWERGDAAPKWVKWLAACLYRILLWSWSSRF